MSTQDIISAIIGALLPVIVSWLKNVTWSHYEKVLLAATLSVLCGFITSLATNSFDPRHISESIVIIYGMSQTIYATWFKSTLINRDLERKQVL